MAIIGTGPPPSAPASSAAVTADTIINSVRDQIPDPVYDAAGNPLPSTDGNLLRASTLYRWLSQAVKIVVSNIDWLIDDWWALPKTAFQPNYVLDSHFVQVSEAYADGWALTRLDEADILYPNQQVTGQPIWFGVNNRSGGQIRLFFWPVETASDPAPTLSLAIGATSGTDPIQVSSTTGFLNYGYVLIEQELIQYQTLNATMLRLGTISRGAWTTGAVAHAMGVPVTHCSLWCKGKRMPTDITGATSPIELPSAFLHPLELYVLSKARRAEQEFQEASNLMKEFYQEIERIAKNPYWKVHQGAQVRRYGEIAFGGLAYGRVITR